MLLLMLTVEESSEVEGRRLGVEGVSVMAMMIFMSSISHGRSRSSRSLICALWNISMSDYEIPVDVPAEYQALARMLVDNHQVVVSDRGWLRSDAV
jgi:hypothetical protein